MTENQKYLQGLCCHDGSASPFSVPAKPDKKALHTAIKEKENATKGNKIVVKQ